MFHSENSGIGYIATGDVVGVPVLVPVDKYEETVTMSKVDSRILS